MFDYNERKAQAKRDAERKRGRQNKRRSIFSGIEIEPSHQIVDDFVTTDEHEVVAELMYRHRLNGGE